MTVRTTGTARTTRARRISRIVAAVTALGIATTGCDLFSDDGGASSTDAGAPGASAPAAPGGSPSAGSPTSAPFAPPTMPSAPPTTSAAPSTAPATGPGSSTLVPALQAAAERAVAGNKSASLIALDIRNGEIVSTVHRQAGMSGAVAPGSTFKIVTSALLMQKNLVTPSSKAACPKTTVVNGQTFKNINDMVMPAATFRQDFAQSCNTAFIDMRGKIADNELSTFATRYFGLNSDAWKVADGQGTVDGIVPAATGENDKAAQMIGQGALRMNPLTMASVVATALTGRFHQPVLERGMPVYERSEKLSPQVTQAIRSMMIECATTGSASSVFKGMTGVGAKTGTAEVGDGTNGWMVAFRGNIAVAVYVEGGASGSSAAGPIVREYLSAVTP